MVKISVKIHQTKHGETDFERDIAVGSGLHLPLHLFELFFRLSVLRLLLCQHSVNNLAAFLQCCDLLGVVLHVLLLVDNKDQYRHAGRQEQKTEWNARNDTWQDYISMLVNRRCLTTIFNCVLDTVH